MRVSTAGGLVFRGKVDGNLVAYDAKTGDELWTFQTGLGHQRAADDLVRSTATQYVAVAVGWQPRRR